MELIVVRDDRRALEDYLTTIYRLEEIYGIARTCDIARELRVKPGTVTKMISKLAVRGYVAWAPYRGVKLTERGRQIAERIIRRHRIAECFFSKMLGFDLVKSHVYAHMLEHLPDEVFDRLYEVLGKPGKCPHGNPIPGSGYAPPNDRPLTSFRPRTLVKITRILCDSRTETLMKLRLVGIELGMDVCIESSSKDGVALLIGESKVSLDAELSMYVRGVEKGAC